MVRAWGLLILAACAAQGTNGAPTAARRAVVDVLAVRHEVDCAAALRAGEPSDLVWIAENWQDPGWIAVRAAECLASDPAYDAAATRWAADPAFGGLAASVADRLDDLPEDRAVRLAGPLLDGPHATDVRDGLAASRHAAVRTLAGVP